MDRISMLPDELLVHILSFLTLKEATATRILCCRWRYLWTVTSKLDFDGVQTLLKVQFGKGRKKLLLDKERQKYIGGVNYGIASRHDSTIEEFRVFFNLTKTHKSDIDKWLVYALARKVQRLELNLTNYGCRKGRDFNECYTFPYELLPAEKGNFSFCYSIDFKHLEKLSLNYVNVNGEALEFFLRNCPLLEHLSVSQSRELSSLRVTGPLPALKRLEISCCHGLSLVEIRDLDLIYLKYEGSRIDFLLENVPLLVEIYLGGELVKHMQAVRSLFSNYLPRIEILTIDRYDVFFWEEKKFDRVVEMSNLKQLIVKGLAFDNCSLLPLTNLIRASPCLHKFVLEARHDWEFETRKMKVKKIETPYAHLKEVEFLGYCGAASELELVMHFLKNAIALEKILIDPRQPHKIPHKYMCKYKGENTIKKEIDARSRAREQLIKKVPRNINLEIL